MEHGFGLVYDIRDSRKKIERWVDNDEFYRVKIVELAKHGSPSFPSTHMKVNPEYGILDLEEDYDDDVEDGDDHESRNPEEDDL